MVGVAVDVGRGVAGVEHGQGRVGREGGRAVACHGRGDGGGQLEAAGKVAGAAVGGRWQHIEDAQLFQVLADGGVVQRVGKAGVLRHQAVADALVQHDAGVGVDAQLPVAEAAAFAALAFKAVAAFVDGVGAQVAAGVGKGGVQQPRADGGVEVYHGAVGEVGQVGAGSAHGGLLDGLVAQRPAAGGVARGHGVGGKRAAGRGDTGGRADRIGQGRAAQGAGAGHVVEVLRQHVPHIHAGGGVVVAAAAEVDGEFVGRGFAAHDVAAVDVVRCFGAFADADELGFADAERVAGAAEGAAAGHPQRLVGHQCILRGAALGEAAARGVVVAGEGVGAVGFQRDVKQHVHGAAKAVELAAHAGNVGQLMAACQQGSDGGVPGGIGIAAGAVALGRAAGGGAGRVLSGRGVVAAPGAAGGAGAAYAKFPGDVGVARLGVGQDAGERVGAVAGRAGGGVAAQVGKAGAGVVDAVADVAGAKVLRAAVAGGDARLQHLAGRGLVDVAVTAQAGVADGLVQHGRAAAAAFDAGVELAERAAFRAAEDGLAIVRGGRVGLPRDGVATQRDLVEQQLVGVGRQVADRDPDQHGLVGHPPFVGGIVQVAGVDHGAATAAAPDRVMRQRKVGAGNVQRGGLGGVVDVGGHAGAAIGHGLRVGGGDAFVIDAVKAVVKPIAQALQLAAPVAAAALAASAHVGGGKAGHGHVPVHQARARHVGVVEVLLDGERGRQGFQTLARALGINAHVENGHVAVFAVGARAGDEHCAVVARVFAHLPAWRGRNGDDGVAVGRAAGVAGVVQHPGRGIDAIAGRLVSHLHGPDGGPVGCAAAYAVHEFEVAAVQRPPLVAVQGFAIGADAGGVGRRRAGQRRGLHVFAALVAAGDVADVEIRDLRIGRPGVAGGQRGGAQLQREQVVGIPGLQGVAHPIHYAVVGAHDGIAGGCVQARAGSGVKGRNA